MKKVIAVDFDGCLCKNIWPEIGEANRELMDFLIGAREAGILVVLWTCREGELLQQAVDFCRENGLEFDAVNENVQERTEAYGNDCRKIGADWYLDDKAVTARYGVPEEWQNKLSEMA